MDFMRDNLDVEIGGEDLDSSSYFYHKNQGHRRRRRPEDDIDTDLLTPVTD